MCEKCKVRYEKGKLGYDKVSLVGFHLKEKGMMVSRDKVGRGGRAQK